jgi:thiamine biosynthesis lipoprotein
MSALQWRDWSCTVRVVVSDGRPATEAPRGDVADVATRVVRDLMGAVERSASRFRRDSDVERVNARPGVLVPVQPLTLTLVDVALGAAISTGGACDPTVGEHVVSAGYDEDIDTVRRRPATTAGDPMPVGPPPRPADWRQVRLDRLLGRVGVPRGLRLDLGATAKAWTADAAAARVSASLGLPALVAIGGDVAVAGNGPVWPVLVSEQEGDAGQIVTLASGGLATSSTRGRRWWAPGGERHHLIDPRTGLPTRGIFRTASVLADSCVDANALATAALVWGEDAPDRLAGRPARLVRHDGVVVTTGTWTLAVAA